MATLEDIARIAGVAKSTASVVLRNHPKAQTFTEETRKKVLDVARQAGFKPNFFAANLSGGQPKMLMMCVSSLQENYYSSIIAGAAEQRASELGYRVLLSSLRAGEKPAAFEQAVLVPRGINSLIIIGDATAHRLGDDEIRSMADGGVDVVMVARQVDHPRIVHVMPDNIIGGRLAAQHLYEQGMTRLWIISIANSQACAERVQGAMEVAEELGAPPPYVIDLPIATYESVAEAVKEALQVLGRPEGVLTVGDLVAVSAAQALADTGCRIGKDVAVVGQDGTISKFFYPPLTTVRHPLQEMGRAAAEAVIQSTEGRKRKSKRIVFTPELVVRRSSVLKA